MPSASWGHGAWGSIPFGISNADGPQQFEFVGSGGIRFGGTADVLGGLNFTGSGGILFGGTADVAEGGVVIGSGGIRFGSSADIAEGQVVDGSGGILFGGSAVVDTGSAFVGGGGILFGGSAGVVATIVIAGSGGVRFGGGATVVADYIITGSGGIRFGSGATVVFNIESLLIEQYPNYGETTLTSNYTPGDGHINVASTALPFKQIGSYRLVIESPTAFVKRVTLRVLTVISSTRFQVQAEGVDAAAFTNDLVTAVNTEGAMYATRRDLSRAGAIAGLPSNLLGREGDVFHAYDGYRMRFDGSAWVAIGSSVKMGRARVADFDALFNQDDTGIADATNGVRFTGGSTTGLHGAEADVPTSGVWTVKAKLFGLLEVVDSETPGFGIYARNSITGAINSISVYGNQGTTDPGLWVSVDAWTDPDTLGVAVASARRYLIAGEGTWLRMTCNGTSITFELGIDNGLEFVTLATAVFSADRVGAFLRTSASAQASAVLHSWELE